MPISPIAPYELPEQSTWPAPRTGWKLDPSRAVLLIHDMQEYFVEAFDGGSPLPQVVENISALRDACDLAGVPTVLSAQPPSQHPARRGLLTDLWGDGIATADEAEIIEPLRPRAGDFPLVKWRYSAFVRTDLGELLARLGRDQLIITGIYGHIGCALTAADAFMRDIEVFFAADAIGDFTRADHVQAIDYVAKTCASVDSTAALVGGLSVVPAR